MLSQVGLEQQFGMLTLPFIQQFPEVDRVRKVPEDHTKLRRKLRAMIRWTFSDASFLKTGWAWLLGGLVWVSAHWSQRGIADIAKAAGSQQYHWFIGDIASRVSNKTSNRIKSSQAFQLPNQIQQMVGSDATKVDFISSYPSLGTN